MSKERQPYNTTGRDLSPDAVSQLVESLRPIRKRARIGAAVLAAIVTTGSILPIDVAIGKANVEHSEPSIHTIAGAVDEQTSDAPLTYIDGFARQDSSWQARNMLSALRITTDGDINALEYGENGITIDAIAGVIAQPVDGQKPDTVSLYGYSIGGDVALLTAGSLIHDYDVCVERIYLDHTPASIKDINPDQRKMATGVINALNFFERFGLELQYSGIARQLVNQNIPASNSYIDQVSSSLIIDQYTLGASVNTEDAIANLHSDTCADPVVKYVSSSDPDSDQVIDVNQASETFQEDALKVNLPYSISEVKGAIHGRPDYVLGSYEEVFSDDEPLFDQQVRSAQALYRMQSGLDIHMRIQFHR